ncbi:hypothetical protein DFH09DRAFT_1141414 [Mycena vulgaris]|nr:hypothetical protein DFH09DRAFT_1141414 [Mycena vulgaris]
MLVLCFSLDFLSVPAVLCGRIPSRFTGPLVSILPPSPGIQLLSPRGPYLRRWRWCWRVLVRPQPSESCTDNPLHRWSEGER